jgi:hypothetical protein
MGHGFSVFRARQVDFGAVVDRDPLEARDTEAIAGHYASFVSGNEAVRVRCPGGSRVERTGVAELSHVVLCAIASRIRYCLVICPL